MKIKDILPDNIRSLKPYTSARDLVNNHIRIFLDANENPFQSNLNRYPDPAQKQLTKKFAELKGTKEENILITNGSDESIDILLKAFCISGQDKALVFPPTYGIYEVRSRINNVELIESPLDSTFNVDGMDVSRLIKDPTLKLVFICSPNNPTGHTFNDSWILALARSFHGMVIVDEAYIDFSRKRSLSGFIDDYPNLVVLQTMSKAWGMAGARIGITIAVDEVISILKGIKLPYNISSALQTEVMDVLNKPRNVQKNIDLIIQYREDLTKDLNKLQGIRKVFPSQANFLLIEMNNADLVFRKLIEKRIQVRKFTERIPNCLRISIGTKKENKILVKSFKEIMG